jgi:hypothetical protein
MTTVVALAEHARLSARPTRAKTARFGGALVAGMILLQWASLAAAQPAIQVSLRREQGSGVAWGVAQGDVAAPVASVVRVLEDYGSYADLFPHFTESRVLSQRGGRALVYAEAVCIGAEYWFQLRMDSRHAPSGGAVIEARMVQGNPRRFEVRWTVAPGRGGRGARVSLEVITDADVPVPRALLDMHNRAAARMGIESLRARMAREPR